MQLFCCRHTVVDGPNGNSLRNNIVVSCKHHASLQRLILTSLPVSLCTWYVNMLCRVPKCKLDFLHKMNTSKAFSTEILALSTFHVSSTNWSWPKNVEYKHNSCKSQADISFFSASLSQSADLPLIVMVFVTILLMFLMTVFCALEINGPEVSRPTRKSTTVGWTRAMVWSAARAPQFVMDGWAQHQNVTTWLHYTVLNLPVPLYTSISDSWSPR